MDEKKDRVLQIRLSEVEKIEIERAARSAGFSISEWVRRHLRDAVILQDEMYERDPEAK